MRWLVVHPGPEFSVHDVHAGWVEGLRQCGEQVFEYNMSDRLTFYDSAVIPTGNKTEDGTVEFRKALDQESVATMAANGILAACYQLWPDVVLIVSGFFTPPRILEVIRARRHKMVMLNTEAPYEDRRQLELSSYCDVALVNDSVTLDAYRQACGTAVYAPHAYRPGIHFPAVTQRPSYDLAFSGTGYASRVAFFTGMGLRGLKVGLAGNWAHIPRRSALRKYLVHPAEECLDNVATAGLYRDARAGINFYRREAAEGETADGWACGPREIEMAACGLWFLRDPRGEGDELFPMLPTFEDAHTAGELLRWGLRNDTVRHAGAAAARQAVESRTFRHNAEMLLRLLDRQPVTL